MLNFIPKSILKLLIISFALFFFSPSIFGQFPQIGRDIVGIQASDHFGSHIDLSKDGKVMAVSAVGGTSNMTNPGRVDIYEWTNGDWVRKGVSLYGEATDDLARVVSLSDDGNIVAIGSPYNDGNGFEAGHVRVYQWNGTMWRKKGGEINGDGILDRFGFSVALSSNGNTMVVGAPYAPYAGGMMSSSPGHVSVYEWNGNGWVQKGVDVVGEPYTTLLGWSVDIDSSGNIIVLGGPSNDGNGQDAGHVRVYEWDGNVWMQKGGDIDGEAAGDQSGIAVSMSSDGSIIAVGAMNNDGNGQDAGHVRVYEWNGNMWVQKGVDIDGEAAGDQSGWVFSLGKDGNRLAVGAFYNDDNGTDAGHVRLYEWVGNSWTKRGIDIDGQMSGDNMGMGVKISENTLAIGSYKAYSGVGKVEVFSLSGISGSTYFDLNTNCQIDTLEEGVPYRRFTINPGSIIIETDANGYWGIDSLPVGTYTITPDTNSNDNYQPCASSYTFAVTNPDSLIQAPTIGYQATTQCTSPHVTIHAAFLRLGFSNQRVNIWACNDYDGTAVLDSAYAIVTLDSLLTVDSVSLNYISLGNNQYKVYLDSIYPGQCIDFWLDCTLSRNAILGQSLCMSAKLYPVDSCVLDTIVNTVGTSCSTLYDESYLVINSSCINNDTISFTITNTGGNMTCWSQVRLYTDGVFVSTDSIQLASGQSQVFNYAGDGRTWRMEVDQHLLHPGNSQPSTTIELCGNASNWTSNLVNVFPQDDADPMVDIYCGLVTGSYDPNDKTGYPLGVGATNDILPNQKMEYRIRFQNTGTDTAFTVVIRDTLSTDFDIFSVQSGVSSHPYTFRMYGPRVLEWTFNNIMLPDSNVNEPLSNGFVLFEVNQQPNLAEGTVLENSAGIYFDFNAPIITNTSQHTINRFLRSAVITTVENMNEDAALDIQLYPNPTTGALQLQRTTDDRIQIQVIDQLGRVLIEQETSQQNATINMSGLPKGLYFVHINDGQKSITKKVVKE